MKIFLVGFMGSGKSYIGKRLADSLCLAFQDLDSIIEKNEGLTIAQIFDGYGEHIFRGMETNTLQALSDLKNTVIATGGGTPCFNDNMTWMNENGITIYLKTHEDVLFNRLKNNLDERPLLEGKSELELKQYLQDKIKERNLFYEQAQIVYEQKEAHMNVVEDLVEYLGRFIAGT